jgi:hypothetical protein
MLEYDLAMLALQQPLLKQNFSPQAMILRANEDANVQRGPILSGTFASLHEMYGLAAKRALPL